jgi:very-short-patch-repair endonuclease
MRAGLPKPAIQHEIRDRGRLVAIVDFAYPDVRLAIEADGYRWHSGRARWRTDLQRRNAVTALGWRIVHVTWEDLERTPDELLRLISCPT